MPIAIVKIAVTKSEAIAVTVSEEAVERLSTPSSKNNTGAHKQPRPSVKLVKPARPSLSRQTVWLLLYLNTSTPPSNKLGIALLAT